MSRNLPILLHVGFNNLIVVDQIVGLFDYSSKPMKDLVKTAIEEKPRSVIKVSKGRRILTLIILTGDRYVLSAIPKKILCSRLGLDEEYKIEESNPTRSLPKKTPVKPSVRNNGSPGLREETHNSIGGEEDDGKSSESSNN